MHLKFIAMSKVTRPSQTGTISKDRKIVPLAPLFNNQNYLWMIIGGVTIALGMFLMSGGKNQDPNVFDTKVVYSTTRITIAPILIVGGLILEFFAIFKKTKTTE